MKIPKLTPRLSLVADFISEEECKIVADVGTDHAKLPIWLVATENAEKVYASDLRKGPLKKDAENIAFYLGKEGERIPLILGDGTQNIPADYSCLSITGMGGELIADILDRANLPDDVILVLSPMTGAEKLRKRLYSSGYDIIREELVREEEKMYTVIKAKKVDTVPVYPEINEYFSKALLENKSEILRDYIGRYISKFDKALSGRRESGKKHSDEEEIEKLRNEMISLEESI